METGTRQSRGEKEGREREIMMREGGKSDNKAFVNKEGRGVKGRKGN